MSWAVTSYVKKLRVAPNGQPITKGEKLVLFVLSDYYHDEVGYAWASLSHLAQESLHTRQGVIATLHSLEGKGVLSIIRSADAATKRVTNRYTFPAYEAGGAAPTVPTPPLSATRLVMSDDQSSQVRRPGLVMSDDQSSQVRRPGLVMSDDHIFPSYLSSDLSKDSCVGTSPATATHLKSSKRKDSESKSGAVYLAYADGYKRRYGVDPVRNAKGHALMCQLVDRLGSEEAPEVAAFYLSLDTPLYFNARHPLNLLVRDCESLRTQWKCGPSRTKPVGPKAYQSVPPAVTHGEECPPEVAARLAKMLGRDTFSWPAAQECVG